VVLDEGKYLLLILAVDSVGKGPLPPGCVGLPESVANHIGEITLVVLE
jgi:hypothetical protein